MLLALTNDLGPSCDDEKTIESNNRHIYIYIYICGRKRSQKRWNELKHTRCSSGGLSSSFSDSVASHSTRNSFAISFMIFSFFSPEGFRTDNFSISFNSKSKCQVFAVIYDLFQYTKSQKQNDLKKDVRITKPTSYLSWCTFSSFRLFRNKLQNKTPNSI